MQVSLAVFTPREEDPQFVYSIVRFLNHDEPHRNELYDWDRFKVIHTVISTDDAKNLIERLFNENVFVLRDRDSTEERMLIPMECNLHDIRDVGSQESYGYAKHDWPSLFAIADARNEPSGEIWHSYLCAIGQPLFPSVQEGVRTLFGFSVDEKWGIRSRLEVVVPDFRARIRNFVIEGIRVRIEVDVERLTLEDVRLKLYSKGRKKRFNSDDIRLTGNIHTCTLDEEPVMLEACILSVVDGSLVDRVSYDRRYPSGITPLRMYDTRMALGLISEGENRHVEFKEKLNTQNPYEFLESVVAFANTKGGQILLGVNDRGEVRGIRKDYSETIINLIHSHMNPPIEPNIQHGIVIEGREITIVEIPEGGAKPYWLKNHGSYVRRGATDKPISRTEAEQLFKNRAGIDF